MISAPRPGEPQPQPQGLLAPPDQVLAAAVQTRQAQPVAGPSQPSHSDLIWATASSQAVLDDPSLSVRDRLDCLEAEAATYTAAAHLGVKEAVAEQHAVSAGMDGHLGEPSLADWALSALEPEAVAAQAFVCELAGRQPARELTSERTNRTATLAAIAMSATFPMNQP